MGISLVQPRTCSPHNGYHREFPGVIHIGSVYTDEFGPCTRVTFPDSFKITSPGYIFLIPQLQIKFLGLTKAINFHLRINQSTMLPYLHNNYMEDGLAIQIGDTLERATWLPITSGFYTKIGLTKVQRKITEPSLPIYALPCIKDLSNWNDDEFSSNLFANISLSCCRQRLYSKHVSTQLWVTCRSYNVRMCTFCTIKQVPHMSTT